MVAVSGIAFGIIGECAMVGLLSDNIFDSLFPKSTALACCLVILYHQLVFPPIMCAKVASFLCLSEGCVNSLLPCAQFPWVQQYFGVYDRPHLCPVPKLAPCPCPQPCPRPKLFT